MGLLTKIRGKNSKQVPTFKQFNYLNQLSEKQLCDLLQFSEEYVLSQFMPQLENKNVLLISYPSSCYIIDPLLKKKPKCLLNYQLEWSKENQLPVSLSLVSVHGNLKPLAVKPNYFDFVIVPLASCYRHESLGLFSEITSALTNGGRLLFSVIHPTLEFLLYNQNPSSSALAHIYFNDYVSVLKKNHLYLESVHEGIVDKEVRFFFDHSEDVRHYDEFKGLPLVLYLKSIKFVKGSQSKTEDQKERAVG